MKIYKEQVPLGVIVDNIKNLSSLHKAEAKIAEHCKTKPHAFTHGEFEITIESIVKDISAKGVPILTITAQAKKNGVPVFVDNPLYFVNPPILIPDGTFRKELDKYGKEYDVHNYKFDVEGALRQMVVDTIKVSHK